MPSRNLDLHGNVPDKSGVALLLIDVINDLEFDDGQALLEHARPMTTALSRLKRRAKAKGIPVVYVNDNFGKWQSDLRKLLEHCLEDEVRGREIVDKLRPDEDDYFVLKPKHSGFFSTTLDTLLDYLQVHTVILTGIATNICVLFTANDAYMRDFRLVVPSDCVAGTDLEMHSHALEQMRIVLKADVRPSPELDLAALSEHPRAGNEAADGRD